MGHIRREFTKILYLRRTLYGWGGMLVLPFIIAAGMSASSGSGDPSGSQGEGLDFLAMAVETNAVLLPVVIMGIMAAFLLPLLASMAGAQSVAGEAEKGTLRTGLMQPVRRTALLLGKWVAANLYVLAGMLILGVASLIAAAAFFGLHSTILITGQAMGVGEALWRTAAAYAFVFCGMAAMVSVALLLSTLTDSSLTAVAGGLVLVIVMLVLGGLSVFESLRPYLITTHVNEWFNFFSSPIEWGPMWKGFANFAAWIAGMLGLAIWRFRTKDISS